MIPLDTIESTIISAIEEITRAKDLSATLLKVFRSAGDIADAIDEIIGKSPAIVVMFGGERVTNEIQSNSGNFNSVGMSLWHTILIVNDIQDARASLKPTGSKSGLYALADAVVSRLNGLQIAKTQATLQFSITGTPSATVTFGASLVKLGNVYYRPTTPSVVLNGSGQAAFNATCITPGAMGDLANGTTCTWSSTPVGVLTTVVSGTITNSTNGLYQNSSLMLTEQAPIARVTGVAIHRLTFAAKRQLAQVTQFDNVPDDEHGLDLDIIDGDINVIGDPDEPDNPVAEFQQNF